MLDACPVPPSPWPVPIEVYHAHRCGQDEEGRGYLAVSSSNLKAWRKDPRTFLPSSLPPAAAKRKRADYGIALGSALHDYFLTPDRFSSTDYGLPAEHKAKLAGMVSAIVSAEAGTHAEQVRKLIATKRGRSEWSAIWAHETGVRVKVRFDRLVALDDRTLINFDLKSSRESTPDGFRRQIRLQQYYHQAALYELVARALFPGWNVSTRWGFISSEYPHRIWTATPNADKLQRAAEENEADLRSISRAWTDPASWRPDIKPWERIDDGAIPEA